MPCSAWYEGEGEHVDTDAHEQTVSAMQSPTHACAAVLTLKLHAQPLATCHSMQALSTFLSTSCSWRPHMLTAGMASRRSPFRWPCPLPSVAHWTHPLPLLCMCPAVQLIIPTIFHCCSKHMLVLQAISSYAGICVPLYDSLGPGAASHIVTHSGMQVAFVQVREALS